MMRAMALTVVLLLSASAFSQTTNPPATPKKDSRCDGLAPGQPCIIQPTVTFQPDPDYSEKARHKKIQGTVLLSVLVGIDGLPHEVKVVQRLGNGLDEQAVKTVEKWKFTPGTRNGTPVPLQIKVEVEFHLLY